VHFNKKGGLTEASKKETIELEDAREKLSKWFPK